MKLQSKTIVVTKDEETLRLDTLLKERFEACSRSYIHYLFEEGMISRNSKTIKKSFMCKEGDEILVTFKTLPDVHLFPENIPLEILFEDEDIIAVNKPAGMVTHPAPGSLSNTFAGALLYYLKTLPESEDPLRPGIVHRLDKDTTGILLGAKTRRALLALQKMFAERKVQKSYLAICHGYLNQPFVNTPIGRHPTDRKLMAPVQNGKQALTEFKLLEKHNGLCLVEAKPYTGRTHQIRVHAKYQQCPLVGDEFYGPKKPLFKRHLLHAHTLTFIHPFLDKEIFISTPPPQDFSEFWNHHTRS